jgi:hypothetical protein
LCMYDVVAGCAPREKLKSPLKAVAVGCAPREKLKYPLNDKKARRPFFLARKSDEVSQVRTSKFTPFLPNVYRVGLRVGLKSPVAMFCWLSLVATVR